MAIVQAWLMETMFYIKKYLNYVFFLTLWILDFLKKEIKEKGNLRRRRNILTKKAEEKEVWILGRSELGEFLNYIFLFNS